LKILHINNYDKLGGAETVYNLTRKNIPDTINYSGFVKRADSEEKPDISFKSWESDGKLKGTINYIFSFHNYKTLKNFLKNNLVDVIHLHGFFSALSPSVLLAVKEAKKKKKIKVIQTLHDFHLVCPNSSLYNYNKNQLCEKCTAMNIKYPIIFENCERRGIIHSIIKAKRSFISNNFIKHKSVVDHFICPSNFLKEKLIADGIAEEKISIIRNPVNMIQHDFSSVQKKNKICYFGRFSKEKNLSFLINAFTKWKVETKNDFELLLIGEGEEEELLQHLRNESSASQSISIKKFMPFDQLVKEIADAKFFCMSSSCYENSPVSIIEAISIGIIPIVPNIGGMKEMIAFVQAGLLYKNKDLLDWCNIITKGAEHYQTEYMKLKVARDHTIYRDTQQKYITELLKIYYL